MYSCFVDATDLTLENAWKDQSSVKGEYPNLGSMPEIPRSREEMKPRGCTHADSKRCSLARISAA